MSLSSAHSPVLSVPAARLDPSSLTAEEAARLLAAISGRAVSAADVLADMEAGCPIGPGGRINLVHYCAWLLREAQADRDGGGGT